VGRIETSFVGVELVHPSSGAVSIGRPSGAVLKTYSYPMGWVVRHSSGEKTPLDAVLAGDAG
jgi:hypothetical protein